MPKTSSQEIFATNSIKKEISYSILVSSLPSGYGTNWPQSRALTSLDGKGAYLYSNGDRFFELNCETDCTWSVMSQKLPKNTTNAIMMYLPPNVTCF